MKKVMTISFIAFILISILCGPTVFGGTIPSFQGLGVLPDERESNAKAVSADGSVVVGLGGTYESGNGSSEAFRWTSGSGMVGLDHLVWSA